MSKRCVVIGSGMAGLTSAILFAREGWDVTVLEQHYRFGGYLHRFFRDGVGYDTGFHYVGAARKDQLFGRAMSHLGVHDVLDWKRLDPDGFDILRFPGMELRVPEGRDRYRERLLEAFPHERAGIDAYLKLHAEAVDAYGWFNLDLSKQPEMILPYEARSVREVTHSLFTDPKLRAMVGGQSALYGVPPVEAPFGMHAVVTDHYLQGAWTIEGGGDRLAKVLVQELRRLGGKVLLKKRVTAIDVEGGAATAVRTADGERYEADLVFANIHPRLVLDLLPDAATRPAYKDRVRSAKPGRAHFGVYLRVKGDLSPLEGRNLYRYASWTSPDDDRSATPGDIPFFYLTSPGARDKRPLPGVDQVVLGLLFTEYQPWADLLDEGVRGPRYEAYKDAILASFIDSVRADYPEWTVLSAEASTPLSTERFTLSPNGAAYGHYHSVSQMGRYRLPFVSKVRGVVHVGQTVGFPGVCGAMMSAYVACGEILGADRLVRELKEQ